MASSISPAKNVDENIDTNEDEIVLLPFNQYYIDAVIERTYPFINRCDHFIVNFFPKFVNYFIGRYDLISTFEMDFAQEEQNYGRLTKRAEVVHPKTIKYAKKVRGMFSLTNIFDGVFWMWTKYLDTDSVALDVNLREQKETELANVGLLSALLFTVSFEQLARVASDQANDTFELKDEYSYMFICGWTISGLGFLLSTIWAVLFSVAINETYDSLELKRFLRVFDHITGGIGPMFHIQTMFIGLIGFIFGLVGLGYGSFTRDVGHIIVYIEVAFVLSIAFCSLQMFASLRHCRTVTTAHSCSARFQNRDDLINHSTPICCKMEDDKAILGKPCDLEVSHIQAYLIRFLIDECEGNVNLCDANEEEFISYIVAYSINSDCQVDADMKTVLVDSKISGKRRKSVEVDLKAVDHSKTIIKLSGQRLNSISEKRARQFFNHYIEANLFESIEAQDFDIKAYLKK